MGHGKALKTGHSEWGLQDTSSITPTKQEGQMGIFWSPSALPSTGARLTQLGRFPDL